MKNNTYFRLLGEIVFVFILSIGIILYGVSIIKDKEISEKKRLEDLLVTFLNVENQALNSWYKDRKLHIEDVAQSPELIDYAEELLQSSFEVDSLIAHPVQLEIREHFTPILNKYDYFGIFIISPDFISLSSMRNENIGTVNVIAQNEKEKLERVFQGETVLITPFISEIALTEEGKKTATMFIASPIKNKQGEVIAAFTFRLKPQSSLSALTKASWFGNSSNTFAFDLKGRVITQSRHQVIETESNEEIAEDLKGFGAQLVVPGTNELILSVRESLKNNESGVNTNGYTNFRGDKVYGAWLWNEELGLGLTSEIQEKEAMIGFIEYRKSMYLGIALVIALLIMVSTFVIIRRRKTVLLTRKLSENVSYLEGSLRSFIETAPIGIALINNKCEFLEVNPELIEITGYSKEELLSMSEKELTLTSNKDRDSSLLESIRKGEKFNAYEKEYIHKTGSSINIILSGVSFKNRDNWLIIQDITNLKQKEIAIRLMTELSEEFLSLDRNMDEAYEHVLEIISLFMNCQVGHVLVYNELKNALESTDVWYLNDTSKYDAFKMKTKEYTFTSESPMHKEVLRNGGTTVKKDFGDSYLRSVELEESGLTEAYLIPVKVDQKVLVVLEFFSQRTANVNKETYALLNEIGVRLGNILKQKILVEEIRENKSTQERMIASASYPIVLVDRESLIYSVNKKFVTLFGYQEEEIIGKPVSFLIPTRFREQHGGHTRKYHETPKQRAMGIGMELSALKKDGTEFPVEISLIPLNNKKGTVMASIYDISERKKNEEAIRESKERLSIAVQAGKLGVWDWNLLDDTLIWDDSMFDLYDVSRDEFGNDFASFQKLLHPDDIEIVNTNVEQAVAKTGKLEFKFRVLDQKGNVRHMSAKGEVLYDKEGNPCRMTGVNMDISEELETTMRLKQSNKDLASFAYVASHDLQEPLRVISSYLQILESKYSNELPERGVYLMNRVRGASDRMKMLINDLLEFSRIDRRGNPFKETDLDEVMDTVMKDSEVLIQEHGAVVNIEPLGSIKCDAVQIRQVFMNLLNNGIKYRKEGEVPEIRISASLKRNRELEIIFEDNGIGIKEEFYERIFEIFQRLHTREEYLGTGLGLAITKKIIERHHGTIKVESQFGGGSKFIINLPVNP